MSEAPDFNPVYMEWWGEGEWIEYNNDSVYIMPEDYPDDDQWWGEGEWIEYNND